MGLSGPKNDQAALKWQSSSLFVCNAPSHKVEGIAYYVREWYHVEGLGLF